MQVPLFNQAGDEISQIELRDDIFGIEPNKAVMHQAYLRQMANARLGTHQTKTRGSSAAAAKSRGSKKARAAPGKVRPARRIGKAVVVFGPHPRSYEQRMPRKMRRLALKSALAAKAQENQIKIVDEFAFDAVKTREMKNILTRLKAQPSAVILTTEADSAVTRSAHNLEHVKTLRAAYLNIRDLLGHEYLIMSKATLSAVETFFDNASQAPDKGGE